MRQVIHLERFLNVVRFGQGVRGNDAPVEHQYVQAVEMGLEFLGKVRHGRERRQVQLQASGSGGARGHQ